jgi:hypothetical protein
VRGSRLRPVWAAFVVVTLGAFLAAVPVRYRELAAFAVEVRPEVRGLSPAAVSWAMRPSVYPWFLVTVEVVFVATFTVVAAGIVWGHTRDWRAMFFSAVFIGYPVWVTPTLYAVPLNGPGGALVRLVQGGGLLLALHFFLLFPDGRFVPRWTRYASAFWCLYTLGWVVDPTAWSSLIDPFDATVAAFLALMAGWTTGMIAQAARYRGVSDPRERRQTRWVLITIAAAIVGYGAVYLTGTWLPAGDAQLLYAAFGVTVFLLLALPIAIALAVAMLRHHLFDFAMVVNRTIVYGALTATLASVYLVGVFVVPHLLPLSGDSDLLVAASTLTVAVLFAPARRTIQGFVDQRFYRSRYDARRTLETFALRLREQVDLATLDAELASIAAETFQPVSVGVWLPPPEGDEAPGPTGALEASRGSQPRPPRAVRSGPES